MTGEPARIGSGDVAITIGDQELVLKPTYNVARTISQQSGGIMGAIERVLKLDLDTIVMVVSLGLGYGPANRPPKDFAEKLWATGMTDDSGAVVERCVIYLRTLANGGRRPPRDELEEGENRENPQ